MLPAHLRHRVRGLARTRPRPMRPVRQPGHTLSEITLHQACTPTRDTPTSVTDAPPRTAPTASSRCSTYDKTTSAIPASQVTAPKNAEPRISPTNGQVLSISDTELSSMTRYRSAWVRSRRLRISILTQGPRCARPAGGSACPRCAAGRYAANTEDDSRGWKDRPGP
jgi:hypothetical protein